MYITGRKNIKKLRLIFYDEYLRHTNLHVCIYAFFCIWFFEWIYLVQYLLNFWSYTRVIFPYRLPAVLIICFLYWLYIWGISVWRRALFGRFARGDRKLWFKGFTSFWFIELSTIFGIFIAACWMSWGPLPLMPRYFLMQKKSFLFELTFFTYIIWLVYLMRLGLKWYLWKTQAIISSIIIFLISCLLWRDFITLYTRDVIDICSGSKWRYIKLNSIIYSLSANWWTYHFMGNNISTIALYTSLNSLLDNNFQNNSLANFVDLTEYQKYHWFPVILHFDLNWEAFPAVVDIDSLDHLYIDKLLCNKLIYMEEGLLNYGYRFYPKKLGFYPKKIAMWYFLVILKIWHHIMLFIWWFFYLLRLNTKKKSSYTLLSACYFNIYCCFIICLLVYCFNLLPVWENFFRIKPYVRTKLQNWNIMLEGLDYFFSVFTFDISIKGSKYLLNHLFYTISDDFVINFNDIITGKTNDKFISSKTILYFNNRM